MDGGRNVDDVDGADGRGGAEETEGSAVLLEDDAVLLEDPTCQTIFKTSIRRSQGNLPSEKKSTAGFDEAVDL